MGKMRAFKRELRGLPGKALAYQIKDGFGAALAGVLEPVIRGKPVLDSDLREMMGDDEEAGGERIAIYAGPTIVPGGGGQKATAIVTLHGVALYNIEYQPFAFSTLLLAQTINTLANDPEIGTIILDINSPGGVVTGTPEAADAILAARRRKKVVALVNPLAASAAYWLASQASEIVAVRSADVGSIGVFVLHADCSGMLEQAGVKPTFIFAGDHKVDANPYEPLDPDAKAYIQMEVDGIYVDFIKAVARGRGVAASVVQAGFGQGRCMMAPKAKSAGMIDDVATIDGAFARWGLAGMPADARRRRSETVDAQIEPANDAAAEEPVAIEPAAAEPVDLDGCTAMLFRTDRAVGGDKVYLCNDAGWPDRISVSQEFLDDGADVGTVLKAGEDVIAFNVTNGHATYRIMGTAPDGTLVCDLIECTFEGEPPARGGEEVGGTAPVAAAETLVLDPAAFVGAAGGTADAGMEVLMDELHVFAEGGEPKQGDPGDEDPAEEARRAAAARRRRLAALAA